MDGTTYASDFRDLEREKEVNSLLPFKTSRLSSLEGRSKGNEFISISLIFISKTSIAFC